MIQPLGAKSPEAGRVISGQPRRPGYRSFDLVKPEAALYTPPQRPLPGSRLPQTLESLETRRREIDHLIQHSLDGRQLSARQLLVWQARVYDYSQRMDLFSRVVDRGVAAIKTTLNTQV